MLGSILAGVMLYDYLTDDNTCTREHKYKLGHMNEQEVKQEVEQEVKKSCVCDGVMSDTSVIYRIKRGDGELSLPPCKLMGVELGPSNNTNKATLRVMMSDKSVEKEYKTVTDIGKEKKYVKLTPTQYHVNIILKMKEKSVVPITAYYST